ncbi:hypothetical protein KAT92_06695 [Candidatus Babeliales bacterium]|nr:hypothetical protein [Candidatus Babeliales bacterium]
MASEIEICNLALSNIRAGSINSFTEGSLQAQQCNLKYSILRNRVLKESWGFNHKIRALSVLTTEVFNWVYAYQYPTDCLKINRLVGAHEELSNTDADVVSRLLDSQLLPIRDTQPIVSYELFNFDDNKVIGANEADLRIDYTAKITDPNLFSDDFILALSHLLASELAIPLIGAEVGRQLRSDSLQMYKEYLHAAIADDMNEGDFTPPLSEYETIRR